MSNSSDSEDDCLPPLYNTSITPSSSTTTSEKTIEELLEESLSLTRDYNIDSSLQEKVEEDIKQFQVNDINLMNFEFTIPSPPLPCASSYESHENKNRTLFCANECLNYFNLPDVTFESSGLNADFKDLTNFEKGFLRLKPVELEHVLSSISSALRAFDSTSVRHFKPFVYYLMKIMSLHENEDCVHECQRVIHLLIDSHQGVKFVMAEMLVILLNYGVDCEVIKGFSTFCSSTNSQLNVCRPKKQNYKIPFNWICNLKIMINVIEYMVFNSCFAWEDLQDIVKFLMWISIDSSIQKRKDVLSQIKQCLSVSLEALSAKEWQESFSGITKFVMSLEYSNFGFKWDICAFYDLCHIIPSQTQRGVELRKYIAITSLRKLLKIFKEGESGLQEAEYKVSDITDILESLCKTEPQYYLIAIKLVDIVISHLKFMTKEENEILYLTLRKCEDIFSSLIEFSTFNEQQFLQQIYTGIQLTSPKPVPGIVFQVHNIKLESDSHSWEENLPSQSTNEDLLTNPVVKLERLKLPDIVDKKETLDTSSLIPSQIEMSANSSVTQIQKSCDILTNNLVKSSSPHKIQRFLSDEKSVNGEGEIDKKFGESDNKQTVCQNRTTAVSNVFTNNVIPICAQPQTEMAHFSKSNITSNKETSENLENFSSGSSSSSKILRGILCGNNILVRNLNGGGKIDKKFGEADNKPSVCQNRENDVSNAISKNKVIPPIFLQRQTEVNHLDNLNPIFVQPQTEINHLEKLNPIFVQPQTEINHLEKLNPIFAQPQTEINNLEKLYPIFVQPQTEINHLVNDEIKLENNFGSNSQSHKIQRGFFGESSIMENNGSSKCEIDKNKKSSVSNENMNKPTAKITPFISNVLPLHPIIENKVNKDSNRISYLNTDTVDTQQSIVRNNSVTNLATEATPSQSLTNEIEFKIDKFTDPITVHVTRKETVVSTLKQSSINESLQNQSSQEPYFLEIIEVPNIRGKISSRTNTNTCEEITLTDDSEESGQDDDIKIVDVLPGKRKNPFKPQQCTKCHKKQIPTANTSVHNISSTLSLYNFPGCLSAEKPSKESKIPIHSTDKNEDECEIVYNTADDDCVVLIDTADVITLD